MTTYGYLFTFELLTVSITALFKTSLIKIILYIKRTKIFFNVDL
jgi:hypothetical protein